MSIRSLARVSTLSLALGVAAACGSSDTGGGDDTAGVDASPSRPDAAPTATPDAATPQIDAGPPAPDATPGATATVAGDITRSVEPAAGGVGHLYVAIFAEDPIVNMMQAPVAQLRIENADMTAADVTIAYAVEDVPVRSAPYFVVAFLDDNGTVDADDPANAGPDTGDLISLMGLGSPQVTVNHEGTVDLDLDLNLAFPF